MAEDNILEQKEEKAAPVMPDVSVQVSVAESDIKQAKEAPAVEAVAAESGVARPAGNRPERGDRYDRGERGGGGGGKRFFYTKKVCRFCTRQLDEKAIDYKNVELLRRYSMPSGRILPRRISGNCARHQRVIVREIKKARVIALMPFLDR